MVYYTVSKHMMNHAELGEYCTYGVLALENGRLLDAVPDFSPEHETAQALVEQLNKHEASAEHLWDIALDKAGQ